MGITVHITDNKNVTKTYENWMNAVPGLGQTVDFTLWDSLAAGVVHSVTWKHRNEVSITLK